MAIVEVARDGDRRRHERAEAEALHRPEEDQFLDALGRPGERRSRHEHHDAEEKQPLPSIEVRQLPEDRDRDDLYDEEGAEDPSIQTQPSELGDDRRACRRHDGDVHEGQQEPG